MVVPQLTAPFLCRFSGFVWFLVFRSLNLDYAARNVGGQVKNTMLEKRPMFPPSLVLPGVHFRPSSVILLFPHVLIYQHGHDVVGVDGEERGGEDCDVIVLKAGEKISNSNLSQ